MRDAQTVQDDLTEVFNGQSALENSLNIKRLELINLQSKHSALVQKHVGKKQPPQLKIQRTEISDLRNEIAELEALQPVLAEKQKQLENELELAQVAQKVPVYRQYEAQYFENVKAVLGVVDELNALLQKFSSAVEKLKSTPSPIFALDFICKELSLRGLSLESFLNGEAKAASLADNEYLDALRGRYRESLNFFRQLKLPQLSDIGNTLLSHLVLNSGDTLKEYRIKEPAATSGVLDTHRTIKQDIQCGDPRAIYRENEKQRQAKADN